MIALVISAALMWSAGLEDQARQALEKADGALTLARQDYAKNDLEATKEQLKEVQSEVELAQSLLDRTGKNARRKPKQFKFGETKTREMLKRLKTLESDMDVEDRDLIRPVEATVQEVHDSWLLGIMGDSK